jgi:hypothetical protein
MVPNCSRVISETAAARQLSLCRKNPQNVAQSASYLMQIGSVGVWNGKGQSALRAVAFRFGFDELASAADGIALFIKQLFHPNDVLDVLTAIDALAGVALVGLELRKLSLPEAQDVSWKRAEFGNFADPEEELVGNYDLFALLLRSHGRCSFCAHEPHSMSAEAQRQYALKLCSSEPSQLATKKAFDYAKAANQFAEQQLFLFRCFLLCGLLFHWHIGVPPMERTPLKLRVSRYSCSAYCVALTTTTRYCAHFLVMSRNFHNSVRFCNFGAYVRSG